MSDLFGKHILGFLTRRIISYFLQFPSLMLGGSVSLLVPVPDVC